MDRRQRESLDRYITGNYGEDQFESVTNEFELPDTFCPKCQSRAILIETSGPHKKIICAECGHYIKFANKEEVKKMTEKMLKNLLAVIHRDGGHHTEKVGLSQSVEDAMLTVEHLHHRADTEMEFVDETLTDDGSKRHIETNEDVNEINFKLREAAKEDNDGTNEIING